MASPAFALRLSPFSSTSFSPYSSTSLSDINPFFMTSSAPLSKRKKATSSSSSSSSSYDEENVLRTLSALGISLPSAASGTFQVAADWKDTPLSHIIKVELPGMKKEQIKVYFEVDGRVLVVSGEKSKKAAALEEAEEEGAEAADNKWIYAERSSGKFSRRFTLPENAKVDEIKAVMVDGVLTITVPKTEPAEKNVKTIQITDA